MEVVRLNIDLSILCKLSKYPHFNHKIPSRKELHNYITSYKGTTDIAVDPNLSQLNKQMVV